MQGLKELFNKQRVILILCLVILTAAIALFAVSSNSAESLSVFCYTDNNSAAKNISYTDNYGLGQAKLCIINVPYSETIPADSVSDKSDPHCSPLPDGTIDYYVDEKIIDNKEYVFLGSGKIIKKDECNVVDGFVLPENSISVASVNTENQTVLLLNTDWKVPFNTDFPDQQYYTGYLERAYNVKSFNASYLDFTFYYTDSAVGKLNFNGSKIIDRGEWLKCDNGTCVLRLYLKTPGVFYGYTASYTADGKLSIIFKDVPDKLSDAIVALDAGHGGKDCGTIGVNGIYESEVNLNITFLVKEKLEKAGVNVILTRSDNTFLSVDKRQSMARYSGADLFVSVHNNFSESVSSLSGPEVYYYRANSELPARLILSGLEESWKNIYSDNPGMRAKIIQPDGSKRFFPYKVTRIEECPSVLVECGYFSNPTECTVLSNRNSQKVIADGIAKGIICYLNDMISENKT